MTLSPEADDIVTFTRGGYQRTYAIFDLKKHISGSASFNLNAGYSTRVKYDDVTPPPVYAYRYVTGKNC